MRNFGLIGYPLGHSFSKKYFTTKFENERINAAYELYELTCIEDFTNLIQRIDLTGLNVTIPYKETVIPYLDELDDTASEIGAVNVIKFTKDGNKIALKGFNSDVIGFMESIRTRLKPYHQKALVLGTGGAAKAMAYGLKKMGVEVMFVSRSTEKGKSEAMNASQNTISYQQLNAKILFDYTIIVNASPVGTFPNVDRCPDIPYQFLTEKHFLFDAVYNPAETLFLKKGKEQGAETLNGEEMLTGQAEAAWKIWNSLQ